MACYYIRAGAQMIQALQHTSEQISIPGQVPMIQESFAAHFWTSVHMVAHDGPVPTLQESFAALFFFFLDWCPYGGTSVPVPK